MFVERWGLFSGTYQRSKARQDRPGSTDVEFGIAEKLYGHLANNPWPRAAALPMSCAACAKKAKQVPLHMNYFSKIDTAAKTTRSSADYHLGSSSAHPRVQLPDTVEHQWPPMKTFLRRNRELGSDTIIAPISVGSPPFSPSEWFTRKELQPMVGGCYRHDSYVKRLRPPCAFHPQFGSGTECVRRLWLFARTNVILPRRSASSREIFDKAWSGPRFGNEDRFLRRAPVVMLGYDTTRNFFPESAEN